jgi:hypothetical protein
MAQHVKDFVGGVKSTTAHHNLVVELVNELLDRVEKLEAERPTWHRYRVNNLANTNQLIVDIPSRVVRIDPLFCCGECTCSGSGEAHGGA